MKHSIKLVFVVALMFEGVCHSQGYVAFVTLAPPVNALVRHQDGTPVGNEFSGQLYAGPMGTSAESLQPLIPVARFYTHEGRPTGYIAPGFPVLVDVAPPGEMVAMTLRAYDGLSWETSTFRGESPVFHVIPYGPEVGPPAPLYGLSNFYVYPVPEPTIPSLLLVGGFLMAFRLGKGDRL